MLWTRFLSVFPTTLLARERQFSLLYTHTNILGNVQDSGEWKRIWMHSYEFLRNQLINPNITVINYVSLMKCLSIRRNKHVSYDYMNYSLVKVPKHRVKLSFKFMYEWLVCGIFFHAEVPGAILEWGQNLQGVVIHCINFQDRFSIKALQIPASSNSSAEGMIHDRDKNVSLLGDSTYK